MNAYLGYTLRGKQTALDKYYLHFERVLVDLEEGYCDVSVERSLFGLPLVTTASYQAELRDGKVLLQNRGGHIGRMPVHPAVMRYAGVLFADVAKALDRDRKSLVKLGGIELHPQTVAVAPKPQT